MADPAPLSFKTRGGGGGGGGGLGVSHTRTGPGRPPVVSCVLVEAVRGVCVILFGERPDARLLHLRASESVWIAYLYSLTGKWGSEVVSISLANLVMNSL